MKTYRVNIHYDMVYSCDVKAKTKEDAIEKAERQAENAPSSELECVDTDINAYEIDE